MAWQSLSNLVVHNDRTAATISIPAHRPLAASNVLEALFGTGMLTADRQMRGGNMKAPTEHDIQRTILDWLRLNGAVPIRVNSGAFAGTSPNGRKRFVKMNDTPGCSDILACVGGVFVAIEVKRPGAKTDPLRLAKQEAFLQSVRRSQGIGVVATCVEDVVEALRKHGMEVTG